jgi:hypothetical protein
MPLCVFVVSVPLTLIFSRVCLDLFSHPFYGGCTSDPESGDAVVDTPRKHSGSPMFT